MEYRIDQLLETRDAVDAIATRVPKTAKATLIHKLKHNRKLCREALSSYDETMGEQYQLHAKLLPDGSPQQVPLQDGRMGIVIKDAASQEALGKATRTLLEEKVTLSGLWQLISLTDLDEAGIPVSVNELDAIDVFLTPVT